MSNIALFSGSSQVPAFVKQAQPSTLMKSLAGGGATGKRVSIKGGVFRLMVDGKQVAAVEERYLDTVIVNAAAKIGRTYYAGPWDSENPSAPACWSADGDRPDASVTSPQHQRCADCAQNQKGSGQGESRACRFSQRLAVVLANDIEGDVLQLQVPAASLFGKEESGNMPLQAYARFLGAQNVSPDMVITRLKFDTNSESPKLFFKPMRWLTEEEYQIAQEQAQTPDAVKAITMTVASMDGVAPAAPMEMPGQRPGGKPQPRPGAAARAEPKEEEEPPVAPPKRGRPTKAEAEAKAAAKAAPAEEEEAPPPEPAVRASAKPAAPTVQKSSLAQVAAEWDDE